jgi:hypothetical protein
MTTCTTNQAMFPRHDQQWHRLSRSDPNPEITTTKKEKKEEKKSIKPNPKKKNNNNKTHTHSQLSQLVDCLFVCFLCLCSA